MKKTELIFVPAPGSSHLAPTMEIAELLSAREESLAITILIITLTMDKVKPSDSSRIQIVQLPIGELFSDPAAPNSSLTNYFENHKKLVRDAVEEIVMAGTVRIAGIVVDLFCTAVIDVANEFALPSYVFCTSGAASLGLMFHLQSLRDDFNHDITEFKDSEAKLSIPTYVNPVPAKVLPSLSTDKSGVSAVYLDHAKRSRETKGIIINTFLELESYALKALFDDQNVPPVYPVGPILKATDTTGLSPDEDVIMKWLNNHPPSSVVFLCFGSWGAFNAEQVKEIAYALERSGHRFLWSLRKAPPHEMPLVTEYQNFEEVLPEGFLQRTAEIGKVIGWAPQMAVLSHPAVGGFVSHCGWNSTLESVWCGVPMATWPIYAEQQANAFQLVADLQMAEEIKLDYEKDIWTSSFSCIVTAEQIERGIRRLMDPENQIRKKVQLLKEKGRTALKEGGYSYASLSHLIKQFVGKN